MRAYQSEGRLVLSDRETLDKANADGRWIKGPVADLGAWR